MAIITRRCGGFTLVEVMAVVVILGILAGAVAWGISGTLGSARLTDAGRVVAYADRLAREQSRVGGQAITLTFDLDEESVTRTRRDGGEASAPIRLPRGHGLGRILVAGRDEERGRVQIPVSGLGISPSYGLLIEANDGKRLWLLVAGLTGQIREVEDEAEVTSALALLR